MARVKNPTNRRDTQASKSIVQTTVGEWLISSHYLDPIERAFEGAIIASYL